MSLRQQLLAISVLLLALPWAGCQFVREMETTLRDAQASAVAATASAIAAALRDQPALLYTDPGRLGDASDAHDSLYVHVREGPMIVDGYADDWEGIDRRQRNAPGGKLEVRYAAQERGRRLYLLLEVVDADPRYANPQTGNEGIDRVLLRGFAAGRETLQIATSAPGRVRATVLDARMAALDAQRVRGVWQDTADGYRLELELPASLTGSHLGFTVIDADNSGSVARAGTLSPSPWVAAPWLVRQSSELSEQLRRFAAADTRIRVTDRQRFIVGAARNTSEDSTQSADAPFWLLQGLYRAILADIALEPVPRPESGRMNDALTAAALSGDTAHRWYAAGNGDDAALVVAAAPIQLGGNAIGSVQVLQDSEAYLALADRATGRLLGITLLVLAAVIGGLFGYASLLGWRIARLGRAAADVTDRRGAITRAFPRSHARDEIGELSRRFGDLLDAVEGYNHYLSQLARRLGHELRTPIAIIQSSLDNLEQAEPDADGRDTYLQRAREGLQRLSGIVSAMSEASRLEESIAGSVHETVELDGLLRTLAGAYGDAYGREVQFRTGGEPMFVTVAPDCLVQALDKLMDNANAFADRGSPVTIDLSSTGDHAEIAVCNQGPTLEPSAAERIFQPMVSTRSREAEDGTHLGLGLHIVQLVARHYGGSVDARNLPDDDGVRVLLRLPLAGSAAATAKMPAA